jgi:hypothetical protein
MPSVTSVVDTFSSTRTCTVVALRVADQRTHLIRFAGRGHADRAANFTAATTFTYGDARNAICVVDRALLDHGARGEVFSLATDLVLAAARPEVVELMLGERAPTMADLADWNVDTNLSPRARATIAR